MGSDHDPPPPASRSRGAADPAAPADGERRSSPRLGDDAPPSSSATAPVLVIDDSEIAREEICRVLRAAGWQVIALPSPIGATQAIVRHQARIVVVDVFMPTIRGDRLLTLFRKNPRLGNLSVILVSGHAEHELERLQTEVQADAVVSKRNLERLPGVVKRLTSKVR